MINVNAPSSYYAFYCSPYSDWKNTLSNMLQIKTHIHMGDLLNNISRKKCQTCKMLQ